MELEIERVHRELLATSRQAGMADVATGVLHNVGNVLNSVNVSATLIGDHVRHTKAVNIAKVAALFDEHKADLAGFLTKDARGQMIPSYLSSLAETLVTERKALNTEIDDLRNNVEHIKNIVAMQQAYARVSGVFETVSVPDIVEDACTSTRVRSPGTRSTYSATTRRARVTTDKHKVMQILINLVRNAKYACDESDGRTNRSPCARRATTAASRLPSVTTASASPRRTSRGSSTMVSPRAKTATASACTAARSRPGAGRRAHRAERRPRRGATFVLELPYKPATPAHEDAVD